MKTLAIILLFVAFQTNAVETGKTSVSNVDWNNSALSTAARVNYLSPLEKDMIFEINKLRSNPAKYAAEYIVPLANRYQSRFLYYPGDKPLLTKEGISALNECVRVMKRQKPLPLMYPSYGLTKAANDHVKDQSRTGQTGHRGSDRSNCKDRMERYGDWGVRIAENIAYGGINAQQVVIYLLIDDGVRDRGHRKNFLNPDFKQVGVATGKHPGYVNMTVMDFAGAFTDK
ncbi:MAG TPA: CAP domain-containing protein [Draconibacterium sp.]|nr:CAP domain-containing protein [Draconibacterium sp.]